MLAPAQILQVLAMAAAAVLALWTISMLFGFILAHIIPIGVCMAILGAIAYFYATHEKTSAGPTAGRR